MTTTHILGDHVPRKSNYDPDLARKVAKYYEEHPEALKIPLNQTSSASHTFGPLVSLYGDYLKVIQEALPETFQTSAELQKARVELNARKDYSLNKTGGFYTANVLLYGVEKRKPFFLFGGREAFLRLYVPHIEEVCRQISESQRQVYIPPNADKAWAMKEGISSGALKRFDLAELIEIKAPNSEYGCFVIDTNRADQLKGAKRELAELIHGQGDDYFECMQMLAKNNISQTQIILLLPDYIISRAGNNLIGRASWLENFHFDSNFSAVEHRIEVSQRFRGVRKK